MKKLICIVSLALLFCFAFSCQNKAEKAELEKFRVQAKLEEQNREIVRRTHNEVWSKGNMAVVDEIYAPAYVAHYTSNSNTQGLEELKKTIIEARTAIPDLKEDIEQIVADGDFVVTRFSSSGTFTGIIMGVAFKDLKVLGHEGIAIHRIVNGKIVEQWTIEDALGLMQQLGMELKPKETKK
jgi:predicted ester cyclase